MVTTNVTKIQIVFGIWYFINTKIKFKIYKEVMPSEEISTVNKA